MKHIFEDDSYQFHTSKNNYFELHDIDRTIWRFYRNNKATSFHLRGNPSNEFKYINLSTLDDFAYLISELDIAVLDSNGILSIMRLPIEEYKALQQSLVSCAKEFKSIKTILSSHGATVSQEKIIQWIKAGDL